MWRVSADSLWFAVVLALLCVSTSDTSAEEPKSVDSGKESKREDSSPRGPAGDQRGTRLRRTVAPVRHAKAEDVAKLLAKHFERETDVQVLTDPAGNSLLISANPETYEEVLETLAELDQPRRPIAVEVIVVEIPAQSEKDSSSDGAAKGPDTKEFEGPIDQVNARLKTLVRSGEIVTVKRLRVETVEHRMANGQNGAEVPLITNVTVNQQTGRGTPIVERRSIGTIVQVTPHITEKKDLLLELVVRDDRIFTPENALVLGTNDNGPIVSPDVISSNLQTIVRLTPGHAVVAQGMRTAAKGTVNRFLAIVTAKISEPPAKE